MIQRVEVDEIGKNRRQTIKRIDTEFTISQKITMVQNSMEILYNENYFSSPSIRSIDRVI